MVVFGDITGSMSTNRIGGSLGDFDLISDGECDGNARFCSEFLGKVASIFNDEEGGAVIFL